MKENRIPSLVETLQLLIRVLERKLGACICQHPGDTIAKMKELNVYPRSDPAVVYFWNEVQKHMEEILSGGEPEAQLILFKCLQKRQDLRDWESELWTEDLPGIYVNLLVDMPDIIAELKQKRLMLKMYLDWQNSDGYRRFMRGYHDRFPD